MNNQQLKKLRDALPTHYLNQMQERVLKSAGKKYSTAYIYMVLHGMRNNNLIVDVAICWAQELRAAERKRLEKINELTQ